MDSLVAAYPIDGVAARAAATARTVLRERLEKIDATSSDNVVAALAVDGGEPA